MRKNVTIGFSPQEFMRFQGAAAVAQMPLATYLKWLIKGESSGSNESRSFGPVLQRLDEIAAAVAKLPRRIEPHKQPAATHGGIPSQELITTKLRERGVPSSTIRQVVAVLDELSPSAGALQ
jgi:hypothetical protein